jgi:hypothetical protein
MGRFLRAENSGRWCADDIAMSACFIWDPEFGIPLGISFGWKFGVAIFPSAIVRY